MRATSRILSGIFGFALCLTCNSGVQAQNTSQRADHPRSDTTRNDADNPPNDLSAPGGPGSINGSINHAAARGSDERPLDSASDKQFLERAVMRGLTQIEYGKTATQKSSSAALKTLSQQMVEDRSKLNARLGRLAGKLAMAVPGSLDSTHQARVDKLLKLSGEAFDRAFIKAEQKSHEWDVKAFEQESTDGADPAVREFALKTLPMLKKHLEAIKNLDSGKSAKK